MVMMSEMSEVEKFKNFLKELFRVDLQDLDFGIYKIMKIKQDMILKFIDEDLIATVESNIKEFPDPQQNLMTDVFNLSYEFFSRYYTNGDFIPQVRYGGRDKYMIPYNGQEVKLYWATKNSYYVKTTENFTKYSFVVSNPLNPNAEYKINFKIKEADLDKNYVVSEKKYFLITDDPININDKEIDIFFNYRPMTGDENKIFQGNERRINDSLKQKAEKNILNAIPEWLREILSRKTLEKEIDRTIIRRHIDIYFKKNDMDYFIVKNLRAFLNSELDNFIKNEILSLNNEFKVPERNRYLAKVISTLCKRIINQISQIYDFERKLWEKKKFVYNVNYVITLDRIAYKEGGIELIKKILKHDGMNNQIQEWKELGLLDNDFNINSILSNSTGLLSEHFLNEAYEFLPLDTKYFKDLELEILSLFENLDDELDGMLIHSENYQALNAIQPKFKEKVQTIYIDPPFNKEQNADYLYNVKYKDSTWATMLENRISLAKYLLKDTGSIFVRCDYNGNWIVRPLMNDIFGKDNFRNEIIIAKSKEFFKTMTQIQKFSEESESLIFFSKTDALLFNLVYKEKETASKYKPFLPADEKDYKDFRIIDGEKYYSPEGRKWGIKQEDINKLINERRLIFENKKWYLITYKEPLKNVWVDRQGYSRNWNFNTENSEIFLKRVIESTSNKGDLVMDFFLGSGTTTAVAHKLGRKWLGVEMGDHLYTVVLPRMKKVIAYDKSEISKEKEVKENYNENKAGGFFKYCDLEQYEDTLNNIKIKVNEQNFDKLRPYLIEYILNYEISDSVNKEMLSDPFNVKMKIVQEGIEQEVVINLIETFNLWLGLNVEKILSINNDNRQYIFEMGRKDKQRIIIIWRNTKDLDYIAEKNFIDHSLKINFKIDSDSEGYIQVLINNDSVSNFSLDNILIRSLDLIFFDLQWGGPGAK